MKQHLITALVAAALALGACAKESSLPNPTGKATVSALNRIEASPEIAFLIEERAIGAMRYRNMTITSTFDDLDYTFNFDVLLAGLTERTRIASQHVDVQKDVDYTFVLSGDLAAPDITIWETDQREWTDADTTFEVQASNLATSLGTIDIYIADAATPPAVGSQFATLDYEERGPTSVIESGEYVITVTPAGDDATILFASNPVVIPARSQMMMSVFEGSGNDLSPVSVRLYNLDFGGTIPVVDSRFPPKLRFIHASLNFGDADFYIPDTLTTPLVTGHAFKDVTTFLDVTAGTLPVTYTAPGNTGSILLEFEQSISPGIRTDLFVVRNAIDNDVQLFNLADRRSVSTVARIGYFNAASSHDFLDLYLVPSGELIDEATPQLPGYPPAIAPFFVPTEPGSYDLYITPQDDKTPLAGPVPVVADFGDVIEIVIFDNVDPNVVDVEFLPPP
jgi:hypothetical protein